MKFSRTVLKVALPACLAIAPLVTGVTTAAAEDIDSREYKIMLDASAFIGDYEGNLGDAIKALQESLAVEITAAGLELEKELEPEEIRFVQFLDTKDKDLRTHGFVLRKRGDLELDDNGEWKIKDGKTKYTLKFRSIYAETAAGKDVAILDDDTYDLSKVKEKFEEDVTIGTGIDDWVSIYSVSGSGRDKNSSNGMNNKDAIVLKNLDDAANLYPGLTSGLAEEGYIFDTFGAPNLKAVSGLTIHERTYEGAEVDLGEVDADLALTAWYEKESDYTTPAVVELSFDYKTDDEDEEVKANAAKLYQAMLELELVDIESTTKTAFVYSYNDNKE